MTFRVGVVGGGIAGLVAAYRLQTSLGAEVAVTLLEPGTVGGQLSTVDLAGAPFDVGAEAFVARRPEVPALLDELGLGDRLVAPAGRRPLIYTPDGLHPLPAPTLMGIPAEAEAVAGVVSAETIARISDEPGRALDWIAGADVSVGRLVRDRFGADVVARSVDPLLGGVYAGSADHTGLRAALPQLAAALDAGAPSLTDAVRRTLPTPRPGPVFGAIAGGYRVLVDALAAAIDTVVTAAVTRVRRRDDWWTLDTEAGSFDCDALVLAVPPPALAQITASALPQVATAAGSLDVSHPAVVALALRRDTVLPDASGVLVATDAGLRAKAFTFSSRKWNHLDEGVHYLRASFGRHGGPSSPDAQALVAQALADLETITGVRAEPIDQQVRVWSPGIPQYQVGHRDVVAEAMAALPESVALAGAWIDGVGVPACVASGAAAAERIVGAGQVHGHAVL